MSLLINEQKHFVCYFNAKMLHPSNVDFFYFNHSLSNNIIVEMEYPPYHPDWSYTNTHTCVKVPDTWLWIDAITGYCWFSDLL